MHLLLVGLSHRTAPVDLRERLDFQTDDVAPALKALAERTKAVEATIVSTCNRAELYAACEEVAPTRADLVDFLGRFHGIPKDQLTPHVYEFVDLGAARHLFRVAAGLDSLVVGEPQILGQLKEAHAVASEARSVGPLLTRLFHAAFAAGKRIRSETGLGSGAVSVGFAAVALARKIFGDLKGRAVAVIGAGEIGKLTAQHMKSQGAKRVTIVSRTLAHAARTAEAIGGATAAPWDEMDTVLAASDVVITATGSPAPMLTKAHIEAVMKPRCSRPLFIIDIAVPRDVEPEAGEIEQVFLYNIDDLQATVSENLARRASEIARAEAIVAEEVEKFGAWFRSRSAIPTIVALRQRFESIRRAELERLEFKMSALSPDARARVDEITHLLVEKLLLTPTEQLKAAGDADTTAAYVEAVTRLFGLTPAETQNDERSPIGRSVEASPYAAEPLERAKVEPFARDKARHPR